MVDSLLLSFAFGAGVLSFFSPCAFPMLPAYVSYALGRPGDEGGLGQGLLFGGSATLGMVGVFGGLGGVLSFAGARLLGQAIPLFGLGMGVLLVALGLLLLATDRVSFALPLRSPDVRRPFGFLLYGAAYALVSLGCTFPIFVLVVTGALLTGGFASGFLIFLVYALGLGIVMTFLSVAVATSRKAVTRRMGQVLPYVRIISALVLMGVGAYIVYYYASLVLPIPLSP